MDGLSPSQVSRNPPYTRQFTCGLLSVSQSNIGSSVRPSSEWSETSQSNMVTDSMAQRTLHGKRKNPSYDTESELDRPGSGGSATGLHSATAPSVVPVPRASASAHQRRRRRQQREARSSEDFTAVPPGGLPQEQPQGNSEEATSSHGQDVPPAAPGANANPGGSSCPTCWLCRGPAASGRVVEFVAVDRGPAVSPDFRTWMPDVSGDFGANAQDTPSYSIQPVGQPAAAWEATGLNSAQFQVPRFPVGWTGNEQGDSSSMAWAADASGGFGNVSYTGFPGPSVPVTPTTSGVGSSAESMGGYGFNPAGGQDSVLLTPVNRGMPRSDGGFMGPFGSFPSVMNSEPADGRPTSRN